MKSNAKVIKECKADIKDLKNERRSLKIKLAKTKNKGKRQLIEEEIFSVEDEISGFNFLLEQIINGAE